MNNIVRWNPIREMAAMQSAIDRMFENTWRDVQPGWGGSFLALDVYETDNTFTVLTLLPGIDPDAINISLRDGVLTISGEIPQPRLPENSRLLVQERPFGKFSRSVNLPRSVDADNVNAQFENGVLTLTLPVAPNAQPRTIRVNTVTNGKHN